MLFAPPYLHPSVKRSSDIWETRNVDHPGHGPQSRCGPNGRCQVPHTTQLFAITL